MKVRTGNGIYRQVPFSLTAANPFDRISGERGGSSYKGRLWSGSDGLGGGRGGMGWLEKVEGNGGGPAAKPLRRKRTRTKNA